METIIDGCRLCLDLFAENSFTIESPALKQQMQAVFQFVIQHKEGYPTKVCQSCSYTISEFYQYSEKVRLNQEKLNSGNHSAHLTFLFEVDKLNSETESKYFDHNELPVALTDKVTPSSEDTEAGRIDEGDRHPDEPPDEKEPILFVKCDVDHGGLVIHEKDEPETNEPSETPVILPEESMAKDESICRKMDTESEKPSKASLIDDTNERKPNKKIPGEYKAKRDRDDLRLNEFFTMTCDLCGNLTSSFAMLLKHFRTIHKRPGYIVCCKKKFFRRPNLLHHMALHMNPNAFRCDLCNRNYKTKEYLDHHNVRHHGSGSFKCDSCSQAFPSMCSLQAHSCKFRKVECPECGKKVSKNRLGIHIRNMHSGTDRRIICDTCGQEFLNRVCFEEHKEKHLGIEAKRFQCKICQKWIKGKRHLRNHIQVIHNEKDQTHICDICNKQYPNTKALKKHKALVHVERKFECEFCGKKFKQALMLKEHRTIHTGEMLYTCGICGATMNSNANFYNHTRKKHPQEWAERKSKAATTKNPNKQA